MRKMKFNASGELVEHIFNGVSQALSVQSKRSVTIFSDGRWPLAMQPLKLLAQAGDKGAGDIIARTIGPLGGDAFKAWYEKTFGRPCGCNARQEFWNLRFPLK